MTQIDQPLSHASPDAPHADQQTHQHQDRNVSESERILSIAGGAAMAVLGLSRGSFPGVLLAAVGGSLIYRGATGYCHLYEKLGIDTAHQAAPQPQDYFDHGIHVEHACTIKKYPWELYAFWRNFENLPRIMSHLEAVHVLDGRRSHWIAKAPAGQTVAWDAEIINDEPNALIAWRSLGGADVDNAGSVRFVPTADGSATDVKIVMDYIPPAGRLGSWIASLFGENPEQQLTDDLQRFKETIESGSPAARGA
jgi:uncharacterized membrane protein